MSPCVAWLVAGAKLVLERAFYYQHECQIAGVLTGVDVRGEEVTLRMRLTGTTHEPVLKLQSGKPDLEFRVPLARQAADRRRQRTISVTW